MTDQETLFLVGAGLIVIGVLTVLIFFRRKRTGRLREHFGPEYDQTVLAAGGRGKAEADLVARERRVDRLTLRPLTATERDFYLSSWTRIQAQFVDDPADAVRQADQLLGVVMSTAGYPVADFDQRLGDISVDHPLVVEHYRAGHGIAVRHASGQAGTEDLRQAMIHYRTLFDELVQDTATAAIPRQA